MPLSFSRFPLRVSARMRLVVSIHSRSAVHNRRVHLRSKKIGKYNIQMCTTTPCMVLGAYDVLDTIKTTLNCKVGGEFNRPSSP